VEPGGDYGVLFLDDFLEKQRQGFLPLAVFGA
jgi:hypothetical protein